MGESVRMLRSLEKVSESLQNLEGSRKVRTVRGGSVGIIIQSYIGAERDAHDQYMT